VIVFVHGVPETEALWDKVRAAIGRESVALSLPGFGCTRPLGFGATKDDYVDWLLGELDRWDGHVDVVGHDWGAPLAFRVATKFGDRLRSWVIDVGNVLHPDYEWLAFAQVWQTPGEGEAFFAAQSAVPAADRGAAFVGLGVSPDDALAMASKSDETMGACILDLYRSATPNPYADWKDAWGPTAAPGLVLHPSEDPFSHEEMAADVARQLGARFETLDGMSHWWMLQGPEKAAAVLTRFWDSL
jgi:pimeloyl-ACP methyl ester carboxylesterase